MIKGYVDDKVPRGRPQMTQMKRELHWLIQVSAGSAVDETARAKT